MPRPVPTLSAPARRELQAVLETRVASLIDQRRLARARGDTGTVNRVREDLSALRRAGTLLGCPVPANTGVPRSLRICVLAALEEAGRPMDAAELLAAVARQRPGRVEVVDPGSVKSIVCRLAQRGILTKEGPQNRRRYALAATARTPRGG